MLLDVRSRNMNTTPITVCIPAGLEFSDLRLRRDPATGQVDFEWAPIRQICEASGLDFRLFKDTPEDNVAGLLVAWYTTHRASGGAPDPVQEQLLAEVEAEDLVGPASVISHDGAMQ
jgi:hypothetical protein